MCIELKIKDVITNGGHYEKNQKKNLYRNHRHSYF